MLQVCNRVAWVTNSPYLADYFLRAYWTHALLVFEGPMRGRSWLKALSYAEVGGQSAGIEQLL